MLKSYYDQIPGRDGETIRKLYSAERLSLLLNSDVGQSPDQCYSLEAKVIIFL